MKHVIHELINMKARKIELEVELGISTVDIRHLSSQQIRHIDEDLERKYNSAALLNMVNQIIKRDETIIMKKQ